MTTQPVDMFGGSESVPSVSFKDAPVGATVTGKVTEAPSLVQSRDFDSGNPAFWPDGNPKMSVVTKLMLTNGEERGLWAPKPSAMFAAIAEAQKTAGALIAVGGTLTVTFTGTKPAENARLSPQKLYTVTYVAPNAFEAQADPVGAASAGWAETAQNPPPAWSQPAPAAPAAAPAVQFTPEQVAAAKAAGIQLPGI
jgi:hypothetical protein